MQVTDFSSLANFTAIDFETAHGKMWSICQIGLVRVENGVITKELELLVQPPNNEYHWGNTRVHGISRKTTANAPAFNEVWHLVEPHINGQHVVAHNATFDCTCLEHTLDYFNLPQPRYQRHCTVKIYKRNLALLCETYGIELKHHNALSDARACAALFMMHLEGKSPAMIEMVKEL
jgi:DNA polymerase-3 subunit epsilon